MAKAFEDNNQPDPRLNENNKTHSFLTGVLRSFKRLDPAEKPQKAITPNLLAYLYKQGKSQFHNHISDLCNGAFFFACRSCEYSATTGTRKTKTITVKCVAFRIGHRLLTNKTDFKTADSVSITFISQKNEEDFETVTQHKTSNNLHCPVKIWARIINRVLSLPNSSTSSPINAYWDPTSKSVNHIHSTQILASLRWAARELGKDRLGYTPEEIGCHSIRSGAAMAMYLARHPVQVPTYTIMLQGRWCSDAFLRYIRKQVKEFSIGVSEAMISKESYDFFHVANEHNNNAHDDPRVHNNAQSLTSSINGSSAASKYTRVHVFE